MAMWTSALALLLAPGALGYNALLSGPRGARGAPLAVRHARASTSVMQYDDYNDYDDGYNNRGRSDTYARDPNDNAEVDVAAVEQLIAERTECRRDRDFDSADRIRDQLRSDYSVTIYDRDMMWFVQSDRGGYNRGGGGGYGRGGGGGYNRRANYERDPNDNAEVDVARVEQLVAERADCRSDRDFTSADAIRDELRNVHSVTVSDRDMTWSVGDSYSYNKPRFQSQPRDFGPEGHDYTFVPAAEEGEEEAEGLDDALLEKINGILADRLNAKFARRFDEADAARETLEGMGVKVQDKAREWRYRPFVMPDYGPLGHDYTRAEDDAKEIDDATLEKINALIAQRLEAKLRTTYAEADQCKDELAETYNVFINDRLKGWRADGGVFPTHQRIEGDGDKDLGEAGMDEAAVTEMLKKRALARKEGDYEEADAIKKNLREQLNVALDDKQGTWRVVKLSGGYYRIGPKVDPETADAVHEKLERLAVCQAEDNEEESASIMSALKDMDISIDSRLSTWRKGARERRGRGS